MKFHLVLSKLLVASLLSWNASAQSNVESLPSSKKESEVSNIRRSSNKRRSVAAAANRGSSTSSLSSLSTMEEAAQAAGVNKRLQNGKVSLVSLLLSDRPQYQQQQQEHNNNNNNNNNLLEEGKQSSSMIASDKQIIRRGAVSTPVVAARNLKGHHSYSGESEYQCEDMDIFYFKSDANNGRSQNADGSGFRFRTDFFMRGDDPFGKPAGSFYKDMTRAGDQKKDFFGTIVLTFNNDSALSFSQVFSQREMPLTGGSGIFGKCASGFMEPSKPHTSKFSFVIHVCQLCP